MTMKNFLFFIKSHIKLIVYLSLAGLITITLLNIEKISFFEGTNIFNLWGTVQVPISEKTKPEEEKNASPNNEYKETNKNFSKHNIVPVPTSNKSSNAVTDIVINKINDSASTAFHIENNSEYSDNLIKRDEKRFYKLKLNSNSLVSLSFSASGMSSYQINIQDENSMNMEFEVYEERNFSKKMNIYLRAGTYSIRITGGKSWKKNNIGNNYKLMAQILSSENSEAEMNNTEQKANIIPINTEIKASSYKDDVDYFTFTLDKTAFVLPILDFAEVDNDDLKFKKLYELSLEDEHGGVIKEFIFIGNSLLSGKKKSVNLKPGNYLVRVSRIEDSKFELGFHEYNLRVYSEI